MVANTAVVVATYGRAALLPRLVAAFEELTGSDEVEFVVVDDCSPDDTFQVLRDLAARARIHLRVLRQDRNRGPAAARNRGWRATTAPVVVFTDDDCVPEAGWLRALRTDIATGHDLVQGRTIPNPDQMSRLGPFSRTLDVPRMDGFFQTCNIAYRREQLERLDGFDEAFRYPMAEDTDLAWRALAAGARAGFSAAAVVRHDVSPSSAWQQIRASRRWESVVLIVSKHPDIRKKLHSRYFWRHAHGPTASALAGVAFGVAARSGPGRLAAAGLVLPYIRHRLLVAPLPAAGPRRRLLLLPATFAVDAAEVCVLARASIRYRTLVL